MIPIPGRNRGAFPKIDPSMSTPLGFRPNGSQVLLNRLGLA
jgi:hypothetical protein